MLTGCHRQSRPYMRVGKPRRPPRQPCANIVAQIQSIATHTLICLTFLFFQPMISRPVHFHDAALMGRLSHFSVVAERAPFLCSDLLLWNARGGAGSGPVTPSNKNGTEVREVLRESSTSGHYLLRASL